MSETSPLTRPNQERERPADETGSNDARNTLVIRLLLVSAFVVILNETIMGVALPRLIPALGITASLAQWLTTAFMLTMAVVIPITGFLLQRFDTRPVFIAAMSLFSLGTLIAAVAPGFEVLLAGRIVQATGTAIMMPLLFTTVMNLVPAESRGRTMGNISIVISVAPAIGPTISGLILNVLDWRWMFILVLPISLGALALGAMKVVNVTTPIASRFDVLSVILSAFGFGGLVYGLSNLGEAARLNPLTAWVPLIVGAVALTVFVARQLRLQKKDSALLDLRTFKHRTFTSAMILISISMVALFGTIILLPIYMQDALGLQPVWAGLLLLPGGLVMGLLAPWVGRIYDKIGPTALIATGSTIVAAVLWSLQMLDADSPVWGVLVAHVMLSIGLALMFTPLFTAALASLPSSLYSHGSAVLGTIQQVAGAVGTALFVAVMTSTIAGFGFDDVTSDPAATAAGVRAAFLVGAIIAVFAIPMAFLVRRTVDSDQPEGSPAPH